MATGTSIAKLFEDDGDRREPVEFAVQPNSRPATPTLEFAREWQLAYGWFNERCFDGALPDCLITPTRRANAFGFFCAGIFENADGEIAHQIAMNPTYFSQRPDLITWSTLAHEMTHLWREVFGPLNRKGGKGAGGYHDKIWADKMEVIGLLPTDNGMPDGNRTGFRVSHLVIEGGRFDIAAREFLISGERVNWRDRVRPRSDGGGGIPPTTVPPGASSSSPKNTRSRFVCGCCGLKAWARASARLSCRDCGDAQMASS